MVIRRNDQRRRRVVIDEVSQQNDGQVATARKSRPKTSKPESDSRNYAFGANRRNQFKTTDFIPKRFLSFGLLVLTLLTVVCGINLLATQSLNWHRFIGDPGSRAFSLVGVGSLSSWFSSFLLIMTGLASLQIYALRQHRCDDYRGTYRLWLWMSLLFILGSIHCVVDFGSVLANITEAVTQQPVGSKIWALVTFKIFALTLLVVRSLFEVRASRGSLALVVVVWVAYSAATLLQLPAIRHSMVVDYEVYYGNTILFATAMLLISHLAYARFVYLHAQGLIKSRVATEKTVVKAAKPTKTVKPVKKKTKPEVPVIAETTTAPKKSKTRTTKRKKVVSPVIATQTTSVPTPITRPPVPKPSKKVVPPVPGPTLSKSTISPPNPADDDGDLPGGTSQQHANMSKSERRRARKLEKRARRAA